MIRTNDHVLEDVDACLHGLLNEADAATVRKHCDECPICRVAWDEGQKRFDALAALPAVETSSDLIERTERRLEKAVTRRRPPLPLRWFERRSKFQKFAIVAAVLAAMIGSLHVYYLRLSASPYDLRVLGQDRMLAGSETSLRVTVFNQASQKLLAGVPVDVELAPPGTYKFVHLASFQTDENGTGSPRFRLPDWTNGSCKLNVSARIGFSREVISRDVTLYRSWQVMISTDKPVYQPGELIRMRTLALRRPDLKPVAGGDVEFTVTDPKGNVIFRRRDVTSHYGIASADCALADEIAQGTYRIDCRVGNTNSAVAVEVKRHVLPKFKIAIDADRPFYQPGEMLKGSVQADYFFGKPVANATVRVDLAPESSGGAAVDPLTLRTNETGRAEFSLQIPQSTIRPQQEGEDASIGVRATVVDSAGQTESRTISRVVSRNPLRIEVIPESGQLVPGISNVVYLMTTYADGRPAATRIVVSGFEKEVVTSEAGVGTLEFTPKESNRDFLGRSRRRQTGAFGPQRRDAPHQHMERQLSRADRPGRLHRRADDARGRDGPRRRAGLYRSVEGWPNSRDRRDRHAERARRIRVRSAARPVRHRRIVRVPLPPRRATAQENAGALRAAGRQAADSGDRRAQGISAGAEGGRAFAIGR